MDEMIGNAEEFYQSLGIPYRVVNIVSGREESKDIDVRGCCRMGEWETVLPCSRITMCIHFSEKTISPQIDHVAIYSIIVSYMFSKHAYS